MNIYIVSRSFNNPMVYIILGKLLIDKTTLKKLNNDLKYMYPFKILKTLEPENIEDFKILESTYGITQKNLLYNFQIGCDSIVFKTPFLCYKKDGIKSIKREQKYVFNKNIETNMLRIFFVFPSNNVITRGKILDSSMSMIKKYKPIFFVIGNIQGENKVSTSILMKRFLLTSGIPSENIIKINISNSYEECLLECLEIMQCIFEDKLVKNIFIASESIYMRSLMVFIKKNNINKKFKFQYICE